MTKEKLDRILEKLRKLMDLKESATMCGEVGEANAAAAGISRLLKEYDLTLQDIPDKLKEADPVDIETLTFKFSYMQYGWYWNLLDCLARYNGCQIIRVAALDKELWKMVTTYQVVGRKKNREVVSYLASYLCHQFIHIGKAGYPAYKLKYLKMTGQRPDALGKFMKSFLQGCVEGLELKLYEEQRTLPQDRLTALVKVEKAALNDFLAGMDIKDHREGRKQFEELARADGWTAGYNISIHKGVEGKTSTAGVLK